MRIETIDGLGDSKDEPQVHCVALVNRGEQWIIVYRPDQRADALRALGRWAADPDLSFTWHDAAVMTAKLDCHDD